MHLLTFSHHNFFKVTALIAIALVSTACTESKPIVLIDNQHIFEVQLAESPEQKKVGLSSHTSLPQNSGMLFKFEPKATPGFWMKGMQFPIDIIWIDDLRVIGIEHNVPVPTSSTPLIYTPPEPIEWVLEINAGQAKSKNINVGSTIKLELDTR